MKKEMKPPKRRRKKKNLMRMVIQFQKRNQNQSLSRKLKVQGALLIEIK